MAPDPTSSREAAQALDRGLSERVARARAMLRPADGELEQAALLGRAALGDARAAHELAAAERWEKARNSTRPGKHDRRSGGGFATCGRCGAILPGDLRCRSCGHANVQGEHHGSVRRHR